MLRQLVLRHGEFCSLRLTLTMPLANSRDDKLIIFLSYFFSQKIGFGISCNLPSQEAINLHDMSKPAKLENKNI